MKEDIAKLWVDALESGKYQQGHYGYLKFDNRLCCLGVLTELAIEAGIELSTYTKQTYVRSECGDRPAIVTHYNGKSHYLVEAVIEWAGMKDEMGTRITTGDKEHFIEVNGREYSNLAEANDGGQNFKDIAAAIKKHWREL